MNNNSSVSMQDFATKLRIDLKKTVYRDKMFSITFEKELSNQLPIYSFRYDAINNTMQIVVDKNKCSDINHYNHNKEFYLHYIDQALLGTYETIHSYYVTTGEDYKRDLISNVLYAVDTGISLYRLFDITSILDNVVIIYL